MKKVLLVLVFLLETLSAFSLPNDVNWGDSRKQLKKAFPNAQENVALKKNLVVKTDLSPKLSAQVFYFFENEKLDLVSYSVKTDSWSDSLISDELAKAGSDAPFESIPVYADKNEYDLMEDIVSYRLQHFIITKEAMLAALKEEFPDKNFSKTIACLESDDETYVSAEVWLTCMEEAKKQKVAVDKDDIKYLKSIKGLDLNSTLLTEAYKDSSTIVTSILLHSFAQYKYDNENYMAAAQRGEIEQTGTIYLQEGSDTVIYVNKNEIYGYVTVFYIPSKNF